MEPEGSMDYPTLCKHSEAYPNEYRGTILGTSALAKPAHSRYHRADSAAESTGAADMSRSNILFLVVGALAVVAIVLGYQLYQDRKKPEGVNINLGPGGISIQKK